MRPEVQLVPSGPLMSVLRPASTPGAIHIRHLTPGQVRHHLEQAGARQIALDGEIIGSLRRCPR